MTQQHQPNTIASDIITAVIHDLWQDNGLIANVLAGSSSLAEDYRVDIEQGFFEANQLDNEETLAEIISKLNCVIENPSDPAASLNLKKVNLTDANGELDTVNASHLINLLQLKQNNQSLNIPNTYLVELATGYNDFTILQNAYGLQAIKTKIDSASTPYVLCNQLCYKIMDNPEEIDSRLIKPVSDLIASLNGIYNHFDPDNNTTVDAAFSDQMMRLKKQQLVENIKALHEQSTTIISEAEDTNLKKLATITCRIAELLIPLVDNSKIDNALYNTKVGNPNLKHQSNLIYNVLQGGASKKDCMKKEIKEYFTRRTDNVGQQLEENDHLSQICDTYLSHISTLKTQLQTSQTSSNHKMPSVLESMDVRLKNLKSTAEKNSLILNIAKLSLANTLDTKAWQTYLNLHPSSELKLDVVITELTNAAKPDEIKQFTQLASASKNLNDFIKLAKRNQKDNTLLKNFINAPKILLAATTEINTLNKKTNKLESQISKIKHKLEKKPTQPLNQLLEKLNLQKNQLAEQKDALTTHPLTAKIDTAPRLTLNPLKRLLNSMSKWINNKQRSSKFKQIHLKAEEVNNPSLNSSYANFLTLPSVPSPVVARGQIQEADDSSLSSNKDYDADSDSSISEEDFERENKLESNKPKNEDIFIDDRHINLVFGR